MNVLGLSVSASGGRKSMRWSTRTFFSLFAGLLLICGSLALRAAQQTGSTPSTDQSDATTSTKKKTKTKVASPDASQGTTDAAVDTSKTTKPKSKSKKKTAASSDSAATAD